MSSVGLDLQPGSTMIHLAPEGEQPGLVPADQVEGPVQQEMVEQSLFFPGWHGNTAAELRELQAKSFRHLGCGETLCEVYNQVGGVGQALAWEAERDSCTEGAYLRAAGWGCVTRGQRLVDAVIGVPVSGCSIGLATTAACCASATSGVFALFGCIQMVVCAESGCCDASSQCFEIALKSAGSVVMVTSSLACGILCLPCNVVCPEVPDSMGQQKLKLAWAQASVKYLE